MQQNQKFDLLDSLHLPKKIHRIKPFWGDIQENIKKDIDYIEDDFKDSFLFKPSPISPPQNVSATPVHYNATEMNPIFEGRTRMRIPRSLRKYIKKHHKRSMKRRSRNRSRR